MKKVAIIGLIVGLVLVAVGATVPLYALSFFEPSSEAIGIIGGADGPTAIFITSRIFFGSFLGVLITFGIPLVLISLFCLIFPSFVQKNCCLKTTAIALGLSAVGGFGINCFGTWLGTVMENVKDYSIAYPASIVSGVLALVLFFALLVLYCVARRKNFKIVGVILDILTSVIYLPFFFLAEMTVIEWIRDVFHLVS